MRLITLAIVAGIGIMVGVAMYVGQALITPQKKVSAKLNHVEKYASENALDSATRISSSPSKYALMDAEQYKNALPEAFRFPSQPTPAADGSNTDGTNSLGSSADEAGSGATPLDINQLAASKQPMEMTRSGDIVPASDAEPPVAPDRFASSSKQLASADTAIKRIPPPPDSLSTRTDVPVMMPPAMPHVAAAKQLVAHERNPHVQYETTSHGSEHAEAGTARPRTRTVVNK